MNDLQNSIYVLLCEIDDICRKNNIRYYLHAGSVIGAVRHEGIIPWDDDIDIAMTRSEWNRFCDAFESMNFKNRALVTSNKYKDYKFTYPNIKIHQEPYYIKWIICRLPVRCICRYYHFRSC